jgi:hypothetical protein
MRPLLSSTGSFQQRGRWQRLVAVLHDGAARARACGRPRFDVLHIYVIIFVNTIFREEVPCVVRRCGRGHDNTFLFAPANSHVSNSWWEILQTSAASLNLPKAYFTWEPAGSPMLLLAMEGQRCP